jgi:hypothetical protein
MFDFPEDHDVPSDQRGHATLPIRYEDVTQDGRVHVLSIPHATGPAVWQAVLAKHPIARVAQRIGIVPVLTRLVIEGGSRPISVRRPLEVEGHYSLAHTVDDGGHVNRLILTTSAVAFGQVGRTHGPPPRDAGERVQVGRVFGENVFTRLFAPPEQRKIVRFDFEGVPAVPERRYAWRAPDELLEMPPDAEPLDDHLRDDAASIAFGLSHTDSNQHVNSLVYPRLFEEAALRRFAELGYPTNVLARHVEIVYRKPVFAGDRMRIQLRAFRRQGQPAAVGTFVPLSGGKPHCWLRVLFAE